MGSVKGASLFSVLTAYACPVTRGLQKHGLELMSSDRNKLRGFRLVFFLSLSLSSIFSLLDGTELLVGEGDL